MTRFASEPNTDLFFGAIQFGLRTVCATTAKPSQRLCIRRSLISRYLRSLFHLAGWFSAGADIARFCQQARDARAAKDVEILR
jgi:hypothetical protein